MHFVVRSLTFELDTIPECSICSYDLTFLVQKLRCGHSFHKICIQQWFKTSPRCPFCNAEPLFSEVSSPSFEEQRQWNQSLRLISPSQFTPAAVNALVHPAPPTNAVRPVPIRVPVHPLFPANPIRATLPHVSVQPVNPIRAATKRKSDPVQICEGVYLSKTRNHGKGTTCLQMATNGSRFCRHHKTQEPRVGPAAPVGLSPAKCFCGSSLPKFGVSGSSIARCCEVCKEDAMVKI